MIVPLSKGSESTPMSVLQKPALYLLLTTCLYLHRWTRRLERTLSWNRRSVVWTDTVTSPDVCRTSSLTWESSASAPTQPSSHSEPDLRKFCHLNLYNQPLKTLPLLSSATAPSSHSEPDLLPLKTWQWGFDNPDKNLEKVPPLFKSRQKSWESSAIGLTQTNSHRKP